MRRIVVSGLVLFASTVALIGTPVGAHGAFSDVAYARIVFPVNGSNSYSDDFNAPRAVGGTHKATDIFAAKLTPIVAAESGRIDFARGDSSGTAGNMLSLKGDSGWKYSYMHINNDTPGTDDGANPSEWRFAPGIGNGSRVSAGQHIAYVGDSGNAEGTSPHSHFEMRDPNGTIANPYHSLRLAQGKPVGNRCGYDNNPAKNPSSSSALGYWSLGSDGGVFTYGNASFYGSTGAMRLNRAVITMAATPDNGGYWLAAGDGGIFSFGNAQFKGSTGGMQLNQPIVGMTSSPSGQGYWLVASDGGIFAFGDAQFKGSTGNIKLNKPVVGMAATPSGQGYWLVASDGGIFAFGDAQFKGSTGNIKLNKPMTAMAAHPSGAGYWLLASDGGVFAFGVAGAHGSLPGTGLCSTPTSVAIASSATGSGYWIQTADGTITAFGDAKYHGDPSVYGVQAVGFTPAQ